MAGAQAAAGVRHGCAAGGVGRGKEWDGGGAREAAAGGQVRLVKDTRLEAREEAVIIPFLVKERKKLSN